jgi:hypothetical protein
MVDGVGEGRVTPHLVLIDINQVARMSTNYLQVIAGAFEDGIIQVQFNKTKI